MFRIVGMLVGFGFACLGVYLHVKTSRRRNGKARSTTGRVEVLHLLKMAFNELDQGTVLALFGMIVVCVSLRPMSRTEFYARNEMPFTISLPNHPEDYSHPVDGEVELAEVVSH